MGSQKSRTNRASTHLPGSARQKAPRPSLLDHSLSFHVSLKCPFPFFLFLHFTHPSSSFPPFWHGFQFLLHLCNPSLATFHFFRMSLKMHMPYDSNCRWYFFSREIWSQSLKSFNFFFFFFTDVEFIFNMVLFSSKQHCASVFLQIILHYKLLPDNGYNFLCSVIHPVASLFHSLLSVHLTPVICPPLPSPIWQPQICFLHLWVCFCCKVLTFYLFLS